MSGKAIRNTKPIKDHRKEIKLSVIIPSAGEGVRMRSYGPRSLLQINNKTLIQYQIDHIKEAFPQSDIILVCGFDATKLMNNVPKHTVCIENERYTETNVVRSIGMGLRAAMNDNILIVYGDLVFNENALEFPTDKSCIIYDSDQSWINENEVGCTVNGDSLENIFFGLTNRWCQILYLTGKELSIMKNIAFDRQKEKLYGWEVINEIMESGGEFAAYSPKGLKCIDIDSSKDLDKIGDILH